MKLSLSRLATSVEIGPRYADAAKEALILIEPLSLLDLLFFSEDFVDVHARVGAQSVPGPAIRDFFDRLHRKQRGLIGEFLLFTLIIMHLLWLQHVRDILRRYQLVLFAY